jgi:Ca-activated chloride channel family protein
MPSLCPSPLALERFFAGELLGLEDHVNSCPKCQQALAQMKTTQRDFSEMTRSLDARAAFARADRRWRRNAMLVALVPFAAAAAFVVAVPFVHREPAPAPAVAPVAVAQPQPKTPPPPVQLREVSVRGQPMRFGEGTLATDRGTFVLEHTDVKATVTGFVSAVVVTQEFSNPFSQPLEAVYVFPLPDDSAVEEMELTAGTRVIRAQIKKREEARRIYEQAKSEGRRAALLDQERPNIFTQSVANLLPGERVKVQLKYVAPLKYDDGVYTFNFPMTVGPRFIPGQALPGESQGTGTAADTNRVLDASRITPPAERSGHSVSLSVHLEAGAPVSDLMSVSHTLSVNGSDIALADAATIPNRDFILRWRVTGLQKRAALLASGGPGGTFALMLMPEQRSAEPNPVPKEMVFVIDTSGSMRGAPLAAAKRAMRSAIEQMNPDDTFMLIDFADTASAFHDSPLPNLPQHVGRALAYLNALPPGGGTNQLDGLERALKLPRDPRRVREVLLMTDGFIGNDSEIFAAAQRDLGEARIFSFGVGTSVNHYFLSRLAQLGRGFYQYVRPDEDPEPAVERFVRRIERPLLTDVKIDWGGLEVSDVLPHAVPDLFDAQPLIVLGRYRSAGRAVVNVSGMRDGHAETTRLTVELPAFDGAGPGLRAMWARARIEELMMQQHFGESADVAREVQTLGLEYHLVTQYTSLVAADDQRVTNVPGATVAVPNLVPEGTEGDGQVLPQKRMQTIQVIRGKSGGSDDGKESNVRDEYKGAQGGAAAHPPVANPPPNTVDNGWFEKSGASSRALVRPRYADGNGGYSESPENPSKPVAEAKGGDDEFAAAFGGGGSDEKRKEKRDVYIPPAPGSAANDVKDSLGQSDIMEVVKGNVPAIQGCFEKQREKEPGLSGKLVMKWSIETSGRTSHVEVVSEEFKDTYVAACIRGLIKSWKFPRTKTRGDPVVFPFKF